MRNFTSILSLLLLISCAKISYMVEQGSGQISLLSSAEDNQTFIDDPNFNPEHKEKIKKIQEYKTYFYKFFEQKEHPIYSETSILKDKAVTYLLVSSKFDEIKAKEECFPFVGCFTYLGFFKTTSALEYQKDLENEGYFTYLRPVYAYSTLGKFDDPILSSFFQYDNYELAELVFHELFHTIFFIKNEVDLNENLANYFGKEMTLLYFKDNPKLLADKKLKLEQDELLRNKMVEMTEKMRYILEGTAPKSKLEASVLIENFLKQDLRPTFRRFCNKHQIENCYPLKRNWNNASFAAFLTYEKSGQQIRQLHNKEGGDLKKFYHALMKRYDEFEDQDEVESFEKYLFGEFGEISN